MVAILQILQPRAVSLFQQDGIRLNMHVAHVPLAILKASDRKEQGGADDVADLKASMIVAMSERRKLENSAVDGR